MNMKKTALLLLILLGWSIRPLRAQQPQMECWMDSQGLWAWGFADRFAVYDDRPWQYESDRKDGDRRILTLRHGDERLRAELRPTSDTTCTIAVDGGRPQTYRRWDPARGILSYLPADGTPPAPCDYQTDTATIRGYIPNARHLRFNVFYYDALDYINRNEVSAQTDSAGFFEIRLPLSGRSQVFLLQPQRFIHELWLSLGETVFFSFLDGTPYIMSKDSRLELEMSQVPIDAFSAYPRSIQYPHEPDDSTALSEIRKAIAQCDARLDSMTAAHPNLSAIFRQTAKELIGYSALQGLGEQMFETCVEGREQTHPGITQLIDSLLASLPATPTFISDYYDSFWNWHTVYQDYLANRHGRITLNAGLLRKVLDRQNDFRMPDSIALLFDQIETLKNELANKKTEPVVKVEKEYVTTPVSVFFNLNKSAIASKKDLVNVKNLADYSKDNNAKLVVTGYADSATGPADYNRALSQKRAERVADELVKMGVKKENIQIVAKGGVDTLVPPSYNRRATVEIAK